MQINALFWLSSLVCVVRCGWVLVGGGEVKVALGTDSACHRAAVIAFLRRAAVCSVQGAGGVLNAGDKTGQRRRPATLRPLLVRTMVERADANLGLDGWSIAIATGNRCAVVRSCKRRQSYEIQNEGTRRGRNVRSDVRACAGWALSGSASRAPDHDHNPDREHQSGKAIAIYRRRQPRLP